jgi:hypothetical protein
MSHNIADLTSACGSASARCDLAEAAGDSKAAAKADKVRRQSCRSLAAATAALKAGDLPTGAPFDPFDAFAAAYVETYLANLPTGARP